VTGKDVLVKTRFLAFAVVALFTVPSFAAELKPHAFPRPVPRHLVAIINEAAAQYDLDPNLLAAVAFKESRFNARAVSRIGAEGIMQLKPKTARSLGVTNSFDERQNIFGGAKYLKKQLDRFGGSIEHALAAYNAGSTLVAKVGPNATEEAIEYVATIKKYYAAALRAS
jgi:soluble lytic murein transglycosylase-like protein